MSCSPDTPAKHGNRTTPTTPRRFGGRSSSLLAALALYGFAAVVVYSMERIIDWRLESAAAGAPHRAQSTLDFIGWYQGIVTGGPRKPVRRYTSVILIDPQQRPRVPSMLELCEQREFLAHLIRRLAKAGAAAVVIDKYFDPERCAGDNRSRLLQEAVREVSEEIPVIVGVRLEKVPAARGISTGGLRIASTLPLAGRNFHVGTVNLHTDSRRLKMVWTVRSDGDRSTSRLSDGLAFATLRAYDGTLLARDSRLAPWLESRTSPYVSFMPPSALKQMRAVDVLCGEEAPHRETWRDCLSAPLSRNVMRDVRGRIAVVGEADPRLDMHPSVIGTVPGVLLQANYIEALLDGRVFYPMSSCFDFLFGLLIFGTSYVAMEYDRAGAAVVLAVVGGVLITAGVVVYLLAVQFGWYSNPAVGVAGILIGTVGYLMRSLHSRIRSMGAQGDGSEQ